MSIARGDAIAGRYVAEEHLDTGGFGSVWRARDETLERDVALKIPVFETNDEATVLEHFDREKRLLEPFSVGISHGTVVRYLDGDLGADQPFIALEFLTGDPLVKKFGTGHLGTGVRDRIANDLAETLDFLHRNDVVYLDLKPENIIVRRSGRPVLLDFNTAVRPDEDVDLVFEADQFKAPELLANTDVDGDIGPAADVFSWGKLAFYLQTGAKVPTEKVPAEGLDPNDFGGDCSAGYTRIIRRATRPAIEDRYADGTELAESVALETNRGPRAVLTHHGSAVSCAVAAGDTIGRLQEAEMVPWVVLADPKRHISPRHARFERTALGFELEDTSVNGTYVGQNDAWALVLSESGYQTRKQQGKLDGADGQPPASIALEDGAVIAPVHPKYGVALRVTLPDP